MKKLHISNDIALPSVRKLHLINAIRVWLNRAIAHAESGDSKRADQAVKSASEVLNALEHEELHNTK